MPSSFFLSFLKIGIYLPRLTSDSRPSPCLSCLRAGMRETCCRASVLLGRLVNALLTQYLCPQSLLFCCSLKTVSLCSPELTILLPQPLTAEMTSVTCHAFLWLSLLWGSPSRYPPLT